MKKYFSIPLLLLAVSLLQNSAEGGTVLNFTDYDLYGSAVQSGDDVQLARQTATNSNGAIYFNTPVDVTSFNASFSFSFSGTDTNGADGLVFVIKNQSSPVLGGIGGAIGYGGNRIGGVEQAGISNSVGVEFDSWYNPERSDNNTNHVGLNTDGSSVSVVQSAVTPTFNGTGTWYSWIDYDGTTLSVYVSQSDTKPGTATLTYGTGENPFLIEEYTGSSTGLVGFTASTGGVSQTTLLNSFDYTSTVSGSGPSPVPEPSVVAYFGIAGMLAGFMRLRKKITC